jgi:hypothetical protein
MLAKRNALAYRARHIFSKALLAFETVWEMSKRRPPHRALRAPGGSRHSQWDASARLSSVSSVVVLFLDRIRERLLVF